jgi:threonine dehydratase
MEAGSVEGIDGLFIHPVQNDAVMAGNGTAGLEVVDDLPELDAVVIPWGGGGLTTGIASAVKALRPDVAVYTCEPATAAPMAAGDGERPVAREGAVHPVVHRWSRVGGAPAEDVGARRAARDRCVRDPARGRGRRRADARGTSTRGGRGRSGTRSPHPAMAGLAGEGRVVCIVSGGNIDSSRLATILGGGVPD